MTNCLRNLKLRDNCRLPRAAGDLYAGLDRFGRVMQQIWFNGSGAIVDGYGYTNDADGSHDGSVTFADFLILENNYNQSVSSTSWHVAERFVYDAYGQFATYVLQYNNGAWNQWAIGGDYLAWNYQFQGMRLDRTAGWYEDGVRLYSPTLMRFNRQDPMGYINGLDDLAFEGDSPVGSLDPSGLDSIGFTGSTGYGDTFGGGTAFGGDGYGGSIDLGAGSAPEYVPPTAPMSDADRLSRGGLKPASVEGVKTSQ